MLTNSQMPSEMTRWDMSWSVEQVVCLFHCWVTLILILVGVVNEVLVFFKLVWFSSQELIYLVQP